MSHEATPEAESRVLQQQCSDSWEEWRRTASIHMIGRQREGRLRAATRWRDKQRRGWRPAARLGSGGRACTTGRGASHDDCRPSKRIPVHFDVRINPLSPKRIVSGNLASHWLHVKLIDW